MPSSKPIYANADLGINNTGTVDVTSALSTAIAGLVAGSTLILDGIFKLGSTLTITNNVSIVCAQLKDYLLVANGGTGNGVVINGSSLPNGMFGVTINLNIFGGTSACTNAVKFQQVHRSKIDLTIKAGATAYAAVFTGCLENQVYVRCSGNYFPPTLAGGVTAAMPVDHMLVEKDTGASITCNANDFYVILEGARHGYVQTAQSGEGNNTLRGEIEGVTGNPFNVAASLGFRVCNLGMEANSLAALINGAEFAEVGPGIVNFSSAGLTISNAQSPKIDGYYGALTVDNTCFATRLGALEETAPGGIRINDTSAVQGAAITNSTNRPVFYDGPGFPTMATIYHNPFFDLWTASGAGGPPDGTSIPGAATAAKATSPSYPGNPSATSIAVAFSGTTIDNGLWIVPANQPWRDNEYVSIMIPIYTASATNACRVYGTPDNGSSVQYLGEANAVNGWTVIRASLKLVAGQNWRFMVSGWNGTAFAGGFTAYVGGFNVVRGALPPQTLSDSLGRRNFVSSSISFAPPFRGMTAIVGTAPPVVYYAVGTAAASDWKQIS